MKLSSRMIITALLASSTASYGMYDNPLHDKYTKAESVFDAAIFRIKYNKDYMLGGAGVAVGACISPKYTLMLSGAIASYMAIKARYNLWCIKRKYHQAERSDREWGTIGSGRLLSRWRQNNQFGDGIFWPTAYWMKEDLPVVSDMLLRDIRGGKLEITNEKGMIIPNPQPADVLAALKREMTQIAVDLETVTYYTDIYKVYSQPEEYAPDAGFTQLLWPNYNYASGLFVELDMLLKRLEILRDVIAYAQS